MRYFGPTLLLFADVAADQRRHLRSLGEIGDLEGYIDRTTTILVYCSKGYFQSRNCMRELISATIKQKPAIALIDPDASHGGRSGEEVRSQRREAGGSYAKWGFDAATTPGGQALSDHLVTNEPIEWNRECALPTASTQRPR